DTEIAPRPPPEVFGELAALDGEERSADAVCAVDTELLRIARADLDELMERRPHVAREIIRVLAGRVRTATRRLKPADPVALGARGLVAGRRAGRVLAGLLQPQAQLGAGARSGQRVAA